MQLNQRRQRRNAGRNGPAQRVIHQVELLQLLRAHAAANSAYPWNEMQGGVGPAEHTVQRVSLLQTQRLHAFE